MENLDISILENKTLTSIDVDRDKNTILFTCDDGK